jgi:competence protein ComEC
MVVRVVYGEHGLLFPGDIMAAAEKELTAESADLRATILLAPHHGSGTSSTAAFLDRIRPELVVISCGNANRFGFPAEETLARYAERGLRVLRTDIHGAVSLKTDGRRLRVRTSSGEEIAF